MNFARCIRCTHRTAFNQRVCFRYATEIKLAISSSRLERWMSRQCSLVASRVRHTSHKSGSWRALHTAPAIDVQRDLDAHATRSPLAAFPSPIAFRPCLEMGDISDQIAKVDVDGEKNEDDKSVGASGDTNGKPQIDSSARKSDTTAARVKLINNGVINEPPVVTIDDSPARESMDQDRHVPVVDISSSPAPAAPASTCSICLQPITARAVLDPCCHEFDLHVSVVSCDSRWLT